MPVEPSTRIRLPGLDLRRRAAGADDGRQPVLAADDRGVRHDAADVRDHRLDLREDRRPGRRGDAGRRGSRRRGRRRSPRRRSRRARRPRRRPARPRRRSRRRAALLRAAPTSWTRCVVTPQSMISIGSVIASGIAPMAGGGVQSASRSSSSLRRATIGGQCFGPSGCAAGRPGQEQLVERRRAPRGARAGRRPRRPPGSRASRAGRRTRAPCSTSA